MGQMIFGVQEISKKSSGCPKQEQKVRKIDEIEYDIAEILENEGIQYLRDYLHLPPEIVPAILKRQARTDARSRPSQPPSGGGFGGDKMDSDRSAYRRAPGAANGGADKAGAAGPGSAPMEFVSLLFLIS